MNEKSYVVVVTDNVAQLQIEVASYLNSGYAPLGDLKIVPDPKSPNELKFYQSLVRL
jgi:hypothetical protein